MYVYIFLKGQCQEICYLYFFAKSTTTLTSCHGSQWGNDYEDKQFSRSIQIIICVLLKFVYFLKSKIIYRVSAKSATISGHKTWGAGRIFWPKKGRTSRDTVPLKSTNAIPPIVLLYSSPRKHQRSLHLVHWHRNKAETNSKYINIRTTDF